MNAESTWRYRVNIADIMADDSDSASAMGRRIADRLRASSWVRSLPEHELVHQYIRELESDRPGEVVMAMRSIFDEAAYHRVRIETALVVPNPGES